MVSPRSLALITCATAAAALAPTPDVRACSLVEGPMPASLPVSGATTGPSPLLIGPATPNGTLLTRLDAPQTPIAVVVDETLTDLFVRTSPVRAYRPASPLPAGAYTWLGVHVGAGGPAEFFVDPELAEAPPTVATPPTLSVTLSDPEESGCGGGTSCDGVDFTALTIVFPAGTEPEIALLEVRNPATGARRVEIVALETWAPEARVLVWDNPERFSGSLKSTRLCFAIHPVSEEGFVGAAVDLGCVDPRGDDPRVTDERGCTAGDTSADGLLLWLIFVLATRGLASRHREAAYGRPGLRATQGRPSGRGGAP